MSETKSKSKNKTITLSKSKNSSNESVKMKPFISLIGAGYWGKNLLRDFYKLGALHSVCESSPELRTLRQKEYPNLLFLESYKILKDYPDVTSVVIATPATTHFDIAMECLEMNLNIYVEKPLALHYSEGQKLIARAKELNKILMVGHLLQYHPAIVKIKEMILDNMIGKIQYIVSNRLNLGQIRTGENVLWSFAPHDISVILSLMNHNLPEQIICDGFATLNKGICDATTTLMRFGDQYAQINVNWLYPYKEQSLIIVGELGMITFKDNRTDPELLYYRQPVSYDQEGIVVLNRDQPNKVTFQQSSEPNSIPTPLELECQHYIDCCLGKLSRPRTDGEEANRVLAVLELAQKSLDEGGKPQIVSEHINLNDTGKPIPKWWAHSSSIVSPSATIGEGTKIWHNSHVMESIIGKNCSFGQGVYVGKGVKIGNGCKVQNNVNIYSGVECEDGVFLGPNCTTTNDKNPRALHSKGGQYLKTLIKRGASVGAGAVICPGLTLGEHCFVGAGSIVTKDVPAGAIVVGNPAKVIGMMDEFGNKLQV